MSAWRIGGRIRGRRRRIETQEERRSKGVEGKGERGKGERGEGCDARRKGMEEEVVEPETIERRGASSLQYYFKILLAGSACSKYSPSLPRKH